MDALEQSYLLGNILNEEKSVVAYLWTEPEVIDFSAHATGKVCIQTAKGKVELELSRSTLPNVLALLSATAFSKDYVNILFTWNIKSLFSYFKFYGINLVAPNNSVIDLQVIGNFLKINKKRPENVVEAINRGKIISSNTAWKSIYKTLHQPLLFKVLPALETTPVLNESTKKSLFAYYEIEGQINGRVNCLKKYRDSYLPTNMGSDLKQFLKPKGYGMRFMLADYRACEIHVLQWLSQDEKLKQIIESGKDLHSSIFEIITESDCDSEDNRKKSKGMFFPVMYGMGVSGLAKSIKISETTASELIRRINIHFKTACEWMKSKQIEAEKTGSVTDYFGRVRHFEEGQAYLARDCVVQGPTATFCQEKLVELYNALQGSNISLINYIHDAYGMSCPVKEAPDAYKKVKAVLESPSVMCPGLSVKVEIKFGAKLHPMKVLWKD